MRVLPTKVWFFGLALVIALGAPFQGSAAPEPMTTVFEEGTHCVAYRAQKTMFLVATSYVVGKNCDISAQVLPEVGGLYRIEVNVPIRGFSSGDKSRDEDVAKTLLVETKSELTFKSKALTVEQWKTLFKSREFDLEGELTIGDKPFPMKVRSTYAPDAESGEVKGVAKVTFKDFGLTPPQVVAGLVTKTKPDLELHFQLLGNRILGADTIRPLVEEAK